MKYQTKREYILKISEVGGKDPYKKYWLNKFLLEYKKKYIFEFF